MSDEIFHEVEEDLRQQKIRAFWQENSAWIIGGCVAAILLTGALSFWHHWQYRTNREATQKMITALATGDADKITAFAQETKRAHRLLALFAAADLHARKGETDRAVAAYGDIAGMTFADGALRDLARLHAAALQIDTGAPEDLHDTLAGLTDGPWRASALELQALLYAREERMKEAAAALSALAADARAPADMRVRAMTLRSLYAAQAAKG